MKRRKAQTHEVGLFERPLLSSISYLPTEQLHPSPDSPGEGRTIPTVETEGVLVPLMVRPSGPGRFEVIDGKSRLHSACVYGFDQVPVRILEGGDSIGAAGLTLLLNLAREENPIHEARAMARLLQEGYTPARLCTLFGLGAGKLKVRLKLLELPSELLERVGTQISVGTLRALSNLAPDYREGLCSAALIKLCDPEARYTAGDLREARTVQRGDLSQLIARLPRPDRARPAGVAEASPAVMLLTPALETLVQRFKTDCALAGFERAQVLSAFELQWPSAAGPTALEALEHTGLPGNQPLPLPHDLEPAPLAPLAPPPIPMQRVRLGARGRA